MNKGRMYNQEEKGFTLLELAIVILISGMIMAALFNMVQIYVERLKMERLARLENNIYQVMDKFAQTYGRYPCPAKRSAFGDGAENCAGVDQVSPPNQATDDGSRVMVGVFPEYAVMYGQRIYLAQLIDKGEAIQTNFIDPWGNRLSYAVTKRLTDTLNFDEDKGSIWVVDENGQDTDGIQKNAHYVVVSHGSDGAGAVNKEGRIAVPCPDGQGGTQEHKLEEPNCLISHRFVSSILMKSGNAASQTNAAGTSFTDNLYYNDYVFSSRYFQSLQWVKRYDQGTTEPRVNLYSTKGTKIGVNLGAGTLPSDTLDLGAGVARADRAVVLGARANAGEDTGLICTGTDCLNPVSLFNLRCADSNGRPQYITKTQISGNNLTPVCSNFTVTPPSVPNGFHIVPPSCGSGQVVRGIYSDGSILCTGNLTPVAPTIVPN